MILLDANILLLAHNQAASAHKAVARWLNARLNEEDWIGLPWVSVWAFVRIATNRRLFPRPLSGKEALGIVGELMEQPNVQCVSPGPRHMEILSRFVGSEGAVGPLVTDAVIAALAVEYAAVVASADEDFRRFGVKWVNPTAE